MHDVLVARLAYGLGGFCFLSACLLATTGFLYYKAFLWEGNPRRV